MHSKYILKWYSLQVSTSGGHQLPLCTSERQGVNGGTEQVEAQLTDKELLRQFQEVEKLAADDKHLIKTFIDAFITKRQIQRLAH